MEACDIRKWLPHAGLKITPQRVAVFEAVCSLRDHPTAERIIENVRKHYPRVAVGTIYNTLETFVEKGLISKVKTDGDVMRYDPVIRRHFHLFSNESSRIEDYYDDALLELVAAYFKEKDIPGFTVEKVDVQITGRFEGEEAGGNRQMPVSGDRPQAVR